MCQQNHTCSHWFHLPVSAAWGEDYSAVTKPLTPQYCLLLAQEPALTHTVSHAVAMQAQLFVDLLCPSAAMQQHGHASFHA